uniref:NADH dehydrogenase subunit 6 n=1 Tax=Notospermus geniculatus TaxID=416868 RepID=A0A4Y5RTQ1_9BILA|nr:NADH dehydrogenase subunit 6 [Notospermus geniculatus]QCZ36412.1 NADH dehydrogenase subunit 6 [Notospermus geniculatus]
MSLVFFLGLVFGLVFSLPVLQQGVGLVVLIFTVAVGVSGLVGVCGHVWYGFSLFLIYVGSLLVMFGYVVAMAPNFLFKRQSVSLFVFFGFLVGFFVPVKTEVLEGAGDVGGFLYSLGGYFVLVGLGLVLLFTLVCVVKVCYFSKGSLRPFSL